MYEPSSVDLEKFVARLPSLDGNVDDAERVTQLAWLERLKGAAAAGTRGCSAT